MNRLLILTVLVPICILLLYIIIDRWSEWEFRDDHYNDGR